VVQKILRCSTKIPYLSNWSQKALILDDELFFRNLSVKDVEELVKQKDAGTQVIFSRKKQPIFNF